MFKIPESDHVTHKQIVKAYEAKAESPFRAHLGGSLIGRECERELWLTFRWATKQIHNGRMLRLFQRGQMEEDQFVKDLRMIGCEVYDLAPDGKQYRVSACNGHFGGSFDGVARGFIEAPTKWHLVEMKTHNDKSFKNLKKQGVRESKPEHFAQMQVYMYLAEPQIERAMYIAVNKNDDELYTERVELDKEFGGRLVDKAGRIIYSPRPLPRMIDNPEFFKCRMCTHWGVCYGYDLPDVNCRTCAHSTPEDNGSWTCAISYREPIPEENQRQGCERHIYHPDFLEAHAKPIDGDDEWIKYECLGVPDTFINGINGFASSEIRGAVQAGEITLLCDSNIEEIRRRFGATIEVKNV